MPGPNRKPSSSLGWSGSAGSAARPTCSTSTTRSWATRTRSRPTWGGIGRSRPRRCSRPSPNGSTRPTACVIRFHPEKTQRAADALTLNRSAMPPLGADRPFVAPTVQTTKLPNGLELFVVERRDLPKVNVTLVTRAGGVGDPAGKAGVANLTMTAIDLGTKTRKALEIEQAFGDLGTTLTGGAGREGARLGLDVLSRNLSPALAVLADVVRNPTFPEAEISASRSVSSMRSRRAIGAATRSRAGCAPCWRSAGASLRPPGPGAAGDGGRHHARGSGRVPRRASSRLGGHRAGRRHLAGAGHGAGAKHFGGWSGGAPKPVAIPKRAGAGRPHLSRGPARRGADGRGAVASIARRARAGLLRAAARRRGVGRRRLRHAAQPEPAREQGLQLRRVLDPQPVPAAGYWYAGGGVQTNKTKESVLEFDKELKDLAGSRPISADEFEIARLRSCAATRSSSSRSRIAGEMAKLWVWGCRQRAAAGGRRDKR